MFVEKACLRVRNLAGMLLFYRQVIGLEVISETKDGAVLGVGGVGLIELIGDPDAVQTAQNAAGLYHVAFEMPTRKDLARWAVHAVKSNFQLSGAADHLVTESFYLNDPEGNGLEVYASRPEDQWKWDAGRVAMGVFDPDIEDLLKLAINDSDKYAVAPSAMRIGHIHLKVGDVKAAEHFYSKVIGLDVTRQAPGVVFMSSGKYHHHVAANVWESDGAPARDVRAAGLCWFSIAVADPQALKKLEGRVRDAGEPLKVMPETLETADPWGNRIRLVSAQPS
jgi:catechol 2,3-dioxygenase